MIKKLINILVLLVILTPCFRELSAQDNKEELPTGDEIALRINARDEGENVSRSLIMELIDRRGKKRIRETRAFRKYYGKERRTVLFYLNPKNIKDTGFLTIDYPEPDKDDDQWLYLPALRKVRRISASDRGDYFLGTDLTYDDIKNESKVNLNDYSRTTIGTEIVDNHKCYILEAFPVNDKVVKELGYSKTHLWVDSTIWIIRKAIMWDVNGNLLKDIKFGDIRKVQNIWTIHTMDVKNHKTNHSTIFTFKDVDYLSEVKDGLFTEQSLRRGL